MRSFPVCAASPRFTLTMPSSRECESLASEIDAPMGDADQAQAKGPGPLQQSAQLHADLWTIGCVIGEIPSNMILTRVRPLIWIPALEVVWTILTICTSRCNTAQQLYAVRFLMGLAESDFYPGMQYLIGSWYRKDELAKRSCIFHTCSLLTAIDAYITTQESANHPSSIGGEAEQARSTSGWWSDGHVQPLWHLQVSRRLCEYTLR